MLSFSLTENRVFPEIRACSALPSSSFSSKRTADSYGDVQREDTVSEVGRDRPLPGDYEKTD